MTPLEIEAYRELEVLEEMRVSYTERIPEVYLRNFTADLNHRVATAKRPLFFIDHHDHRD